MVIVIVLVLRTPINLEMCVLIVIHQYTVKPAQWPPLIVQAV
jgi:hypothetical protein